MYNNQMPKLEKGSQSAKDRMAHLRSLRKKKGGSLPVPAIPDIPQPPSNPEEKGEGKGTKKKSPWIKWVADYAHKNNMNYFEALKDPQVKKGYHSQK